MTRIIVDLDDDIADRLRMLAATNKSSVEEFARDELTEIALNTKAETRRLARQIVRENRELYRRLA